MKTRGKQKKQDQMPEKRKNLSEEQYRELVENANSIIVKLDTNGNVIFLNNFAESFFGYTKDEILGKNAIGALIPAVDSQGNDLAKMLNELIRHPEKFKEHENENRLKNGKRVWIRWANRALYDAEGRLSGLLMIGNDVTDRKLADDLLMKYTEEAMALVQASNEISGRLVTEDIYKVICNAAVKYFNIKMAWFGLTEEGNYAVRPVAWSGSVKGYLDNIKIAWDNSPTGMGPTGIAIKSGTTRVINSIDTNPAYGVWRDKALASGYHSSMALPLKSPEGKVFGALNLYSGEQMYFKEKRIRLFEVFATNAAMVIENIKLMQGLEEKVRQRTKELKDINLELMKAQDELKEVNEQLEKKVEERTFTLKEEIAERKRAEEVIEKLSHQNELILNSAGEGIFGLDLQGNHTFINPSAARMLGYEVEELLGKRSHTIWHHSRADGSPYTEEECPIYAVYRDEAVHIVDDEVFWRKDGTSFPVRYTSNPILEEGKLVGAVVSFRDITERKRAEEAMKESEEKFRKLASSAQDAIIMMDDEGNLFYCNAALEKIFGFSSIEILGKEMHTIIAPERYHKDFKKGFALFRETGKGPIIGKTLELIAVKKDGTEFPIELSVSALQFKDKWISIGILRDITKRKQAEEIIERLHKQNELILNSAGEGILGVDLYGNHIFINPAAAKMLGYEVEELIGRHSHTTWHHTRADGSPYPKEECKIYAIYRDGAAHIVDDEVFWRKDGTSFPVTYTSTPISEDGKLVGIVVSFRDITEQKRAEKEIIKKAEELERFNRLVVGRERRMIELKQKVNELSSQLGLAPPYNLAFLDETKNISEIKEDASEDLHKNKSGGNII